MALSGDNFKPVADRSPARSGGWPGSGAAVLGIRARTVLQRLRTGAGPARFGPGAGLPPVLPRRPRTEAGRPMRSRVARMAPAALFAGLLALGAGLLAMPERALAQFNPVKHQYVSSLEQTQLTSSYVGNDGFALPIRRAQQFTTGGHPAGYVPAQVVAALGYVRSGAVPRVSIHADASGEPGTSLYILSNPAQIRANANNTFAVPTHATLEPNTKYWVVFDNDAAGSGSSTLYEVSATSSNSEDPGRASGWSIADTVSRAQPNWTSATNSLRIAIRGRHVDDPDRLTATFSTPVTYSANFDENPDVFEFDVEVVFNHPITRFEARNLTQAVHAFYIDSHTRYGQNAWGSGGRRPVMVDDGDGDSSRSTTWKVPKTRQMTKYSIPSDVRFYPDRGRVAVRLFPTFNDDCNRSTSICAWVGGKRLPLWGSVGQTGRTSFVGADGSIDLVRHLLRDSNLPNRKVHATVESETVDEDAGTAAVTVRLRDPVNRAIRFYLNIFNSDSGLTEDDYTLPSPFRVTVPAGHRSASTNITVLDDSDVEANEWIRFRIERMTLTSGDQTNFANADFVTRTTGQALIIRDNDGSMARAAEPLTAAFEDAPVSHDGSSAFTLRLSFSEDVEITPDDLRDHALSATGGTISGVTRVDDAKDLFEVTVTPAGEGAVTVGLRPPPGCEADGAVCTAAGTEVTVLPLTLVRGPGPGLTVADAEAKEGEDETLDFVVTLDPPSAGTVTVAYATSDGTAVAPADYASKNGTLTFAPGETSKTVSVDIEDDTVEDSGETMTLTLSGATGGAAIDDAQAVGTIFNTEPLLAFFPEVPSSHDGSSVFLVPLDFSEDVVGLSYRTLKFGGIEVTGGTVKRAKRRPPGSGQGRYWTIHVKPDTDGDVTITLPETVDCAAAGAVCMPDGRKLAGSATVTIPGPASTPLVSIAADASPVTEGTAASFTLTRRGDTTAALTVNVGVSEDGEMVDGTAPATAAFAAGSATAALTVPTADDEVEESASAVTATVSPGTGYEPDTGAESASVTVEDDDGASANQAPTGLPAITGTAKVGQTLTASGTGIADADGLTGASFAWQWIANDGTNDTEIAGATGATYTLTSAEEGKTVKVRVAFTDDGGAEETLESAATEAVAALSTDPVWTAAVTVAVSGGYRGFSSMAVPDVGSVSEAGFGYGSPSARRYTVQIVGANADGVLFKARSRNDDLAGMYLEWAGETLPLSAAGRGNDGRFIWSQSWLAANAPSLAAASYVSTLPEGGEVPVCLRTVGQSCSTAAETAAANAAPTGLPAITGTARVGETLTASETGIADADGLTNASFAWQWIASDGNSDTEIEGATDATYTLTSAEVGKTVKVRVTFTDDGGTEETLTSAATEAVAAAIPVVSIAATSSPVTEGTAAAFTLKRTGDATDALTVRVSASEAGSALSSTPAASYTVYFAAGSAGTEFSLATENDAAYEADARVTVSLTAGTGYTVDPDAASAAVDVYDNDAEAAGEPTVTTLWSTTLQWADWNGSVIANADDFADAGWSEDGDDFKVWYFSYDP